MERFRPALALLALLTMAGCVRDLVPVVSSKPKVPRAAQKPLDAKTAYTRMSEIDRYADVMLAAERRRLRRAPPNGKQSERAKVVTAYLTELDSILSTTEKRVKALQPVPALLRPLHTLRATQVRESRAALRPVIAAARRDDIVAFNRLSTDVARGEARRLAQMRAEEKTVRRKLGLKGAPPASLTVPERTASKRTASSVASEPRQSAGSSDDSSRAGRARAGALVRYTGQLLAIVTAEKKRQQEWGRSMRAKMPSDPAAREAHVRSICSGAITLDRQARRRIQGLGTPPPEARAYVRALSRQQDFSLRIISTVLASGKDAETMLRNVEASRRGLEMARNLAAVGTESERLSGRLAEIRRNGTATRADWAKLKR